MNLTAPYIWIMTSGIYDVLQIWDQDGNASRYEVYSNNVLVYELEKDDDIVYCTIEDLDLANQVGESDGYNIGVIAYDSEGNSSEPSNAVCWKSDGNYDNNGADPDYAPPFSYLYKIAFYLNNVLSATLPISIFGVSSTDKTLRTVPAVTLVDDDKVLVTVGDYSYTRLYPCKIRSVSVSCDSYVTNSYSQVTASVYAVSSAGSTETITFLPNGYVGDGSVRFKQYCYRTGALYDTPTDCLMFVSPYDSFILYCNWYGSSVISGLLWDGVVEWSTDRSTWTTWYGEPIQSVNGIIYMRGYDNTTFCNNVGSEYDPIAILELKLLRYGGTFGSTDPYGCYGNINTLLQYDNPPMSIPSVACFGGMFASSALFHPPALPATTLTPYCYAGMFFECSSLMALPALPAMELPECCYALMFYNCSMLLLSLNPRQPSVEYSDSAWEAYIRESLTEMLGEEPTDEYIEALLNGEFEEYILNCEENFYTKCYRFPTAGDCTSIGEESLYYMFYGVYIYNPFSDSYTTIDGDTTLPPNYTYYLHKLNSIVEMVQETEEGG